MLKKITSLLLALILAFGLLSLNAFALDGSEPGSELPPDVFQPGETVTVVDSGECGDSGSNVKWTLYSDGTVVISGTGKMESYASSGKGVSPWKGSTDVKKVVVEQGVTSVSNYAFYKCPELSSVSLPNGLERIGAGFVNGCEKLADIEIPATVTNINNYAFSGCSSLTSVRIPSGVTTIYDSTFQKCPNLKEVVISGGTTSIKNGAFYGSNNVTIYSYDGTYAKDYANQKGIPFEHYIFPGDTNLDMALSDADFSPILDLLKATATLEGEAAANADAYVDNSIDIKDFNYLYFQVTVQQ